MDTQMTDTATRDDGDDGDDGDDDDENDRAVSHDPTIPSSSHAPIAKLKQSQPHKTSKSCNICTLDKQKCVQSRGLDVKCDRCEKFKYNCSGAPTKSGDGDRKRRKLSYAKCIFCRRDRKKCNWSAGEWSNPGHIHCDYCVKRHFPCSEPRVASRKKASRRTSSGESLHSTKGHNVQEKKHAQTAMSDPHHDRGRIYGSDSEGSAFNPTLRMSANESPSMGPPPMSWASTTGPSPTISVETTDLIQVGSWSHDRSGHLAHLRSKRSGLMEDDYINHRYSRSSEKGPLATSYTPKTSQLSFPQRAQSDHGRLGAVISNFSSGGNETNLQQMNQGTQHYYWTHQPWTVQYSASPDPFSLKPDPPKSDFKYVPLNAEDKYRLLVLEPGQGDQVIQCYLVSLAHFDQEYEALSYAWGDSLPNREIRISRAKTRTRARAIPGDKFYVRANLYEALLCLRHSTGCRYLWIDAICIDQENAKEKGQQVAMMAEIYNNASNVLVWLGASSPSFDIAAKFLKSLNHMDLIDLDRITREMQYLKKWQALAKVMANQYFSRLWVIQELALARRTIVLSGKTALDWLIFAEGVVHFGDYFEDIRQLSYSSTDPDDANIIAVTGWLHVSGAYSLILTLNKIFYRSDDGVIFRRAWTLNDLVLRLTQFECSDPRDIIYAVLSLAEEKDAAATLATTREGLQLLNPNYEKSVAEVFIEFVEFCVNATQSLDIICRQWAAGGRPRAQTAQINSANESNKSPLPSWVLLRSGPTDRVDETSSQSVSGNSLVGSDLTHPIYNAASSSRPEVQFSRISIKGNLHGLMTAKGVRLATIGSLGDRVLQGIISAETLKMGGWNGTEYEQFSGNLPPRLWRTLVADRSPDGLAAPSWYERACVSTLRCASKSGDIDTQMFMAKDMPFRMVQFLKRVRSVVWNRKFLLSKATTLGLGNPVQLFGIAPKGAKEEDLICILFGCSVPVILRERMLESKTYFEFVGDAYIHGMMEGEAFAGKNMNEIEQWSERFEIQ